MNEATLSLHVPHVDTLVSLLLHHLQRRCRGVFVPSFSSDIVYVDPRRSHAKFLQHDKVPFIASFPVRIQVIYKVSNILEGRDDDVFKVAEAQSLRALQPISLRCVKNENLLQLPHFLTLKKNIEIYIDLAKNVDFFV